MEPNRVKAERQATQNLREKKKKKNVFPARIELATFRVLGGRDNHYTTETSATTENEINVIKPLTLCFLPRARAIDSMFWDSRMILVNCLTSEYTATCRNSFKNEKDA